VAALGVDTQGYKHVLGLREGASENAQVVKDLLADLVERGLSSERRRLFVIDGSKALRAGIHEACPPKAGLSAEGGSLVLQRLSNAASTTRYGRSWAICRTSARPMWRRR
jgi:hypothetical protein